MLRLLLIFLWLILVSFSKLDICQKWYDEQRAVDVDVFTESQIRLICMHQIQWVKDRDGEASKRFVETKTENQLRYLRLIEQCTRKNCVREARRRKKRDTKLKTIRKEIRMLSKSELADLAKAMNGLKNRHIDNITAWDLHTLVHYPDSAPGAHWGPAFLPWHREFLRQFEIALQSEVPSVTLPYWDSTLDQGLPDESDSVLWSDELLGNGNGYVRTGPFAEWDTNVFMPLSQIPVKKLYRSTGGREQDRLMTQRDTNWIKTRQNFSQLTFCHDKRFESMHGLSHVWVGGFMYVIRVSPNDPAFYLHHAFIDNLWEQFRQNSQDRFERENQWATKTCNDHHKIDAQMKPFTILNRDGLSNQYTDEWYEYEPIQHCSPNNLECPSDYLWCDSSTWRCRSKIVYGGNCSQYEGTQICYNSVCSQGRCILPPRVKNAIRQRIDGDDGDTQQRFGQHVWTKTLLIDTSGNGINDEMTRVRVIDLETNQTSTTFGAAKPEFPELPGTIYVRIPKPMHGSTRQVVLEARDQYGRYCQSQCLNYTTEKYEVCQPFLNISLQSATSSPISFTHSMSSRRFLDVDLSIHPRDIQPQIPFMIFICSRRLVTNSMISALAENFRAPISDENYVFFRVTVHRAPATNHRIEVFSPTINHPAWSSTIQKAASAFDPNIVFVQAPNPQLHRDGVRIQVSIRSDDDQPVSCTIKCNLNDGSMRNCDGNVVLHSDPTLSDEQVFTSDLTTLPVLGWSMRRHPSEWKHRVPFLSFHC